MKIGVKVGDQYHFDDTPNFSLESAMTMTKAVQLSIKISGIRIVMSVLVSYRQVNANSLIGWIIDLHKLHLT